MAQRANFEFVADIFYLIKEIETSLVNSFKLIDFFNFFYLSFNSKILRSNLEFLSDLKLSFLG